MPINPRYDKLFEPLAIGPVTTCNRFYQVPHCTGMGYALPETLAAMRSVKAEGGWGVVCTEYASIHPSSDDTPFPSCTWWDDGDIRSDTAWMQQPSTRFDAVACRRRRWPGAGCSNALRRDCSDAAPTADAGASPTQTHSDADPSPGA